jgi:hypothetical protein
VNSTTWKTPAGSVRVLPGRGRVLSIETAGHGALWSPEPPPFAWCLGGERLWFGPEVDWHWQKPDKPDFACYKVPSVLDPDEWTVGESRDGFFSASINLELRCAHRDAFVKLRATRSVELLPVGVLAANAGGIALRTRTELEILGGTPGQPVDFWSLLQVPHGGSMIIPTVGPCAPRDYFAPAPRSEFAVHPSHVEIQIRGAASFKLGIPPDRAAGRAAYVRPVPGGHLVLARSFPVHPELFYCDAPLDAPGTQGDALQFYCDNGSLGPFGELEHRTPALRCGSGPQRLSETAVTRVMLLDAAAFAGWKMQ